MPLRGRRFHRRGAAAGRPEWVQDPPAGSPACGCPPAGERSGRAPRRRLLPARPPRRRKAWSKRQSKGTLFSRRRRKSRRSKFVPICSSFTNNITDKQDQKENMLRTGQSFARFANCISSREAFRRFSASAVFHERVRAAPGLVFSLVLGFFSGPPKVAGGPALRPRRSSAPDGGARESPPVALGSFRALRVARAHPSNRPPTPNRLTPPATPQALALPRSRRSSAGRGHALREPRHT